ncbi:hypothetical protein [Streptomyces rimosus]|uniref:hypothetical protein n=1 Tax=Streptomyces rimosus TaxID=1927 RepID=UPI0037A47EED
MTGKPKKKHAHLRLRSTAAASTTLLLALSTTGCAAGEERCGPAPATRFRAAHFYGTWSFPKGYIELSNLGGKLGQTFTTRGWPKDTTLDQTTDKAPLDQGLSGKGNWRLSDDHTTLGITFDRLDDALERTTIHTLNVGEDQGRPVLYTRVGDPKTCHVFALKRSGD